MSTGGSAARSRRPRRGTGAAGDVSSGGGTHTVSIDLALQGGGSHGAYTWGVLDALLEHPGLRIDGVSGTSAGALNAGVLATGYAEGGPEGARAALRAFWMDIATTGACFGSPAAQAGGSNLAAYNLDANPWYQWMSQWLKLLTPSQLNPLGLNKLRDVARRHVKDEALRDGPLQVFVTATAVTTGQPAVFCGPGHKSVASAGPVTVDALLASACLPQLFAPVVIDEVAYWDGGYTGNPALWPLIYGTKTEDVVLVSINPLERPALPDSAAEIADRINEITFNAGLVGELRAISFVQKLLREQRIERGQYKDLRLHRIADDAGLAPLHPSSKLNTDQRFLLALFELGRASAAKWLEGDARALGQRSTLDIDATYLRRRDPPKPVKR